MNQSPLCNQLYRVVSLLMKDLDTDVSKKVMKIIDKGTLRELSQIAVEPHQYQCPEEFFKDYAAVEFLRKLDVPGDSQTLSKQACDNFLSLERHCAKTNVRLYPYLNQCNLVLADMALFDFISECKKYIKRVLGPLPDSLEPKFGGGATFNDRQPLATVPDKMTSQPTVTCSAAYLAKAFIMPSAWGRALYARNNSVCHPLIIPGNRFTSIPKDMNKRRGICVEPSMNISLQLAVGSYLKGRLLAKTGLDLRGKKDLQNPSKGQKRHNDLAQLASKDGSLATIDLSNASDTVSKNLVKLLLPSEWFELLDDLRSKKTYVNGKWFYLEKFSSMGNGFTFELETLIFASIVHACGARVGVDSFIYGDDIIVPTGIARDVIGALKFFGFEPNSKKTFLDGPFRESCGGDFFKGTAVRPHYLKELPNEPQDWIALANGIRRMAYGDAINAHRWPMLKRAWAACLSAIPGDIRGCRGPADLGDLLIHDSQPYWNCKVVRSQRWFRVYRPVREAVEWKHWFPSVQLATILYTLRADEPSPRDSVSGHVMDWIPFS